MGYTTEFSGQVTIEPPLNEDEISFLKAFNETRRVHRKKGPLFIDDSGNHGQNDPHGDVIANNDSDPDQPGLWCQWVPADDGTALEWDGGEKFYESARWMKYIVENLLAPSAVDYLIDHGPEDLRLNKFTCGHTANGVIYAQGEDPEDRWVLVVENNVVMVAEIETIYKNPKPV